MLCRRRGLGSESPLSPEELKRQAVLSRLQGHDASLEVGLKVCQAAGRLQACMHALVLHKKNV